MDACWFSRHVAYTMAKYGMSMCVLGMAEEFKPHKIGVNALWPRTAITTAATEMLLGDEHSQYSRKPEIMADAAYGILSQNPETNTGNFYIDDEILNKFGVTDMVQYCVNPKNKDNLVLDFFVPGAEKVLNENKYSTTRKDDKKSEGGAPAGKVAGLFKKIESSISPKLSEKVNALYEFQVTGSEAGVWFIDLRTGNAAAGSGNPPAKADCVLTMDGDKFFDMFSGKLKATTAYMTGKLKISGNLQKAMKLEKLMGSLKAKL